MKWQSLMFMAVAATANAEPIVREEVRDTVTARIEVDAATTTLSGEVNLLLTIEGPARVELVPGPLLTNQSGQNWLVIESNAPLVEVLPGNRQRRIHPFRLQPYVPGDKVPIALAPLKVRAGTLPEMSITFTRPVEVEVTTTAEADIEKLQPNTGPEVPAVPRGPENPREQWPIVVAVAGATLATFVGLYLLIVRGRSPVLDTVHDAHWAVAELQRLSSDGTVRQGADVLREYVAATLQIPAPRLTTAELSGRLSEAKVLPDPQMTELVILLEQADLEKFAGTASGNAGPWMQQAIAWATSQQPMTSSGAA